MSNIKGVIVKKGTVGANVENNDGVSGFMSNAPAIAPATGIIGITLATTYLFKSVKEAEDHGINAAYDTDNDVHVYRHITEFFRMAGEGNKLYFMACDPAKDMATMLADHGEDFLVNADSEIRYLMINYNVPDAYAPTPVNGLEPIVSAAIPAAQTLATWAFDNNRPCNVFIEGRGISGLVTALQDLRDIKVGEIVQENENVSLIVGQDYTYADSLTGQHQKIADIGTFTGTKARILVSANPGEVGDEGDENNLDISDAAQQIWLVAGLSDHTKLVDREADLQQLNDKGYIFGLSYVGITGYRWNDDPTCTPIKIDAKSNMNAHTIGLGATQNKLARLVRTALLPVVKSTVPVDTTTGKLTPGMVKYFEGIANGPFFQMQGNGEISGGEAKVDPDSDLLAGDKNLIVAFNYVPTGQVGQVTGTINIKKTL